jgi:hypothetical protein
MTKAFIYMIATTMTSPERTDRRKRSTDEEVPRRGKVVEGFREGK